MNRRSFLGRFFAGAAGVAVSSLLPDDPERLLWVPGQKTFFLPPAVRTATPTELLVVSGGRGNQFITADWFAKEIVDLLQKQLTLSKQVNRYYDVNFAARSNPRAFAVRTPKRFA